ncbi:photosystem reaction center subunit H [Thermoplasma sp. Kam2015]|uniref:PRC-barrel domain-containing protein n=1 Tax=Thermoplasma sp. Kam2015 TaxID=2094122 RepID=UPI000D8498F5|nr:PRC-barrel domain-containing protein [Thermoplasma sp. Kam2015]PYB68003.1 photosystem reaction center subunit H [Thermoplasma sp. Kam2015]
MLDEASEVGYTFEITNLIGKEVYTMKGIRVGKVTDIVLDFDKNQIHGLFIMDSNDKLVKNGDPISIPYNYVKSIGDIVILKSFPDLMHI